MQAEEVNGQHSTYLSAALCAQFGRNERIIVDTCLRAKNKGIPNCPLDKYSSGRQCTFMR